MSQIIRLGKGIMVGKLEQLRRVLDSGIVAVIRAERGEQLADVAEALLAGGVQIMEVTFTVPRALQVLEMQCPAYYPNSR